jgi:hypothetical protein
MFAEAKMVQLFYAGGKNGKREARSRAQRMKTGSKVGALRAAV